MAKAYEYRAETLENGLTVSTVAMPHLHSACISLFVRTGSRHETKETNGLGHFLEHMYFRGCEGFSDSTALNAAMEDLGGTLDGFTMRDLTGYQTSVHPEHAEEAIEILGAMFRSPSFTDMDVERSIIIEEMLDAFDDRGRMVDLDTIAHREAFKNHPLGQPIDGTRKNVRRFSLEDLKKHRTRFYGAKNLVLCCAGRIDPKRCRSEATKAFGQLRPGRRSSEQAPKLPIDTPRFLHVHTDDAQTRVRMSFRTTHDGHPDHTALSLLRRYLDGGLSAKLQVELVEKKGLAYEVGADLEPYSDCGLFDFEFAVGHNKLITTFEALFSIIGELKAEPIDKRELDRLKHRARIGLELGLDSASDLAHWFGATHLFRTPTSPEERVARLEAVDSDQLFAVVHKYLRADRLTIASVGGADATVIGQTKRAVRKLVEAL